VNTVTFLIELKEKNIFVIYRDGKILVDGNKAALTSELVEKLKQQKESVLALYNSLNIESNRQLSPTTFSQQRLWFLDQLEGSVHYNIAGCLRLKGNLDTIALGKAFNAILNRHEALRTTFYAEDEQTFQVIHYSREVNIPTIDLTHLCAEEKEDTISKTLNQEAHRPFVLSKDLMLKVSLLVLSENENLLQVTIHHIASDGWSMGILVQEFSTLYTAFVNQEESPLEPLAIQYSDYAHWQRNWLKGDVLDEQLDYWKQKLSGIPAIHSLPLDFVRSEEQRFVGKKCETKVDIKTLMKMKHLCLDNSATLFMGLHAIFSLLLSRYSGEKDIVIGTPIANREQPDVAPLIGFFANTLVLRSELSNSDSFLELLQQSKKTLLEAYAHQQIPFESLVRDLNIDRSLSYSPVFQIMMVLQNTEQGELKLPGLTLMPQKMNQDVSQFDLSLDMEEGDDGLTIRWSYSTDLFKEDTVMRLAKSFNVLMASVLSDENQKLSSLEILSKSDQEKLLVTASDDKISPFNSVVELFEQQVALNSERIALSTTDEKLSYQELNNRALQLANDLIDAGVKSGSLVGVYLERSSDLIVSLLAIMKVGGVYLPLDPEYPDERLEMMVVDAKPVLIISQKRLSAFSSDVSKFMYVDEIDYTKSLISTSQRNDLLNKVKIDSNELAYVIYTSGSTGKPKGVMITHGNLASYYHAANAEYKITSSDCMLQFSSISFDIFIEEVFLSLLSGATLQLRSQDMLSSADAFWKFTMERNVTFISLPTAYWHLLSSQLNSSQLHAIKLVKSLIVGGEAISPQVLKHWQQQVDDGPKLLNTYGPTETSVIATIFDATNYDASQVSVPIGKAINNTQCYVLDENLSVCPIGVSGELYIGGLGVSAGYLNQEALTKSHFITSPFFQKKEKLYKTGDRVHWRNDGQLMFDGRIDSQIKIRGFRVELGEVERAFESFDSVIEAVVLVKEQGDEKNIAAYLLLDKSGGSPDNLAAILTHLKSRLPNYMMPSEYVLVEQFPMTKNGKIDRKALLNLKSETIQDEYIAPNSETEISLAEIWKNLLNKESISVSANFFDLGGHSLLCIRLLSFIRDVFNVELSIRDIFANDTLAGLADRIEEALDKLNEKRRFEALTTVSSSDTEELVI
jgi:amino acid adenylation domain-containing protein